MRNGPVTAVSMSIPLSRAGDLTVTDQASIRAHRSVTASGAHEIHQGAGPFSQGRPAVGQTAVRALPNQSRHLDLDPEILEMVELMTKLQVARYTMLAEFHDFKIRYRHVLAELVDKKDRSKYDSTKGSPQ